MEQGGNKMKREIKFRGKDLVKDKWCYGCYMSPFYEEDSPFIMEIEERGDHWEYISSKVIKDTVGQYTGLKDKNGVEIYEGDILRSEDLAFRNGEYVPCCDIDEVVWNEADCGYSVAAWKKFVSGKEEQLTGCLYMLADTDDCEIIGNVYDNPELIGRAK